MMNARTRWKVTLEIVTSGGSADTNIQRAAERLQQHVEHTLLWHGGMSEYPQQAPMFVAEVVAKELECVECVV